MGVESFGGNAHMSENWKVYRRTNLAVMRPYVPGESLWGVSVSDADTLESGGMIALDPYNPKVKWYVPVDRFERNFEPYEVEGEHLRADDWEG